MVAFDDGSVIVIGGAMFGNTKTTYIFTPGNGSWTLGIFCNRVITPMKKIKHCGVVTVRESKWLIRSFLYPATFTQPKPKVFVQRF